MSTPARILMVTGNTEPSAPAAGQILLYAKTDGIFYSKNSGNVETPLAGSVASINASGGSTGMTFIGGPITSAGTLTLGGVLGVANGGTGSTTQAGAASAILPSQTGQAGRFLTTNGTTISWASVTGAGSVTSVGLSSANPAISITGSPITTSGTINITANSFTAVNPGIVPASGGGTTNFLRADGTWSPPGGSGTVTSVTVNGSAGRITSTGSPITSTGIITLDLATTGVAPGSYVNSNVTVDSYGRITSISSGSAGSGTVTSINASGGTTGMSFTGGPITTSGTLTLAGTLGIASGGTGSTTATGAINALLPTQAGNAGRFLTTNGTTTSWAIVSGTGTVTSVAATGNNGVTISGSPITTTGTITVGLGAITPTSVSASGTITGSNLSGTNTGDQTITLTGDVTGSGTGSFTATLSNTGVTANIYGNATNVPQITVDAKGRITNVSNVPIAGGSSTATEIVIWNYGSGGSGNFTPIDARHSQTPGVTATVVDGANCIATYSFTGKNTPPKSITTYAQVFSINEFVIKDTTSLPSARVSGGGLSTSPAILSSFTSSNIVTLQTRMSDTGAAAGLGQRAWLMVVFGF